MYQQKMLNNCHSSANTIFEVLIPKGSLFPWRTNGISNRYLRIHVCHDFLKLFGEIEKLLPSWQYHFLVNRCPGTKAMPKHTKNKG